jgi:hypothetical protein
VSETLTRSPPQDVADSHGENVRPLFLGDGCPHACRDGLVVGAPARLTLLQLGFHDAAVGGHLRAGNRGAIRQREHVSGLERYVEGVNEVLGQLDLAGEPDDLGTYADALERQVAPLGLQSAQPGVVVRTDLCIGHRRDADRHVELRSSRGSRPRSASISSSGCAAARMA